MTILILTAMVLIFIAAVYLINKRTPVDSMPPPDNKERDNRDQLRKNGIKIKVEFDQCSIHDYGYSYEEDITDSPYDTRYTKYTNEVAALNVLAGDEMSNVNEVQVNCVELIYHYKDPVTGKITDYTSSPLNMDKDYLQMDFLAKDVYLYVNRFLR